MKSSKVCIITRSPLASLLFKSLATKHTTIQWTINHAAIVEIRKQIISFDKWNLSFETQKNIFWIIISTIKMPFHTSNSHPEATSNVFDLDSQMFLQTSSNMYKFIFPLRTEFLVFWEFLEFPKILNYTNKLWFEKLGITGNFWERKTPVLWGLGIPRNSQLYKQLTIKGGILENF